MAVISPIMVEKFYISAAVKKEWLKGGSLSDISNSKFNLNSV
jgi:hypothetical protein